MRRRWLAAVLVLLILAPAIARGFGSGQEVIDPFETPTPFVPTPTPDPRDTLPPVTIAAVTPAAGADGIHRESVIVRFTVADSAPAGVPPVGVAGAEVRVNGDLLPCQFRPTCTVRLRENGDFRFEFFARDYSGNTEPPRSLTIRIAQPAPPGEFTPPTPPTRFSGMLALGTRLQPGDGTVQAFIGTTLCGTGTALFLGRVWHYSVDVVSAYSRAGCGRDGDRVEFRVGGLAAPETGVFRPGSFVPLDLTVPPERTPSPPAATPSP